MDTVKVCGLCKYWELVPQGCSSFWGRCNYPIERIGEGGNFPIADPRQDLHFEEGEGCPCWEHK